MLALLWQVCLAPRVSQAGMIQNMMDTLAHRPSTPPPAPTPVVQPAPQHTFAAPIFSRYQPSIKANPIPPQELIADNGPLDKKADEIVVYKSRRLLELRAQGKVLRRYRVALGRNPVGHKLYQGDNRTPEGHYRIDMRNANSNYYRSLRISYPDRTDQDVATTVGLRPGDWIMIHGLKNGYSAAQLGHPYRDWTNGCIALDNASMTEVWNAVDIGTPITINP